MQLTFLPEEPPARRSAVAGLRAGLADPRGNLTLTFLGVVAKYQPRVVVWENVPGVLSVDGGRAFGAFLGGLAELGYGWAYRVVDAQFTRALDLPYAVPQRRRRVFVVGYFGDWRRAAAILFDGPSLRWDSPPRRQAGQNVAPTISSRPTGGGGLGTDFDLDGGLVETANGIPEVSPAIKARDSKGPSSDGDGDGAPILPVHQAIAFKASHYTRDKDGAPSDVVPPLSADADKGDQDTLVLVPEIAASLTRGAESSGKGGYAGRRQEDDVNIVAFNARQDPDVWSGVTGPVDTDGSTQAIAFDTTQITSKENRSNPQPGDPSHPIPAVAFNITPSNSNKDFNARQANYAQALDTDGGAPSARGGDVIMRPEWAVRRLTPTECERLMGMPDGYTQIPRGNKPTADGPRYKALGNSWAVNVARVIGERIDMIEKS